jgi:hypothetical protein
MSTLSLAPAIFFELSYVQNVRGFSPLVTGERFLPLTLTLLVTAVVAGALMDEGDPANAV